MLTLRQFTCPECHKPRLYRPEDHKVSDEKVEKELPSGKKISHFKDICELCTNKIIAKYYVPQKSDVKKVLSALEDNRPIGEEKSLEELL